MYTAANMIGCIANILCLGEVEFSLRILLFIPEDQACSAQEKQLNTSCVNSEQIRNQIILLILNGIFYLKINFHCELHKL